MPQKQKAEVPLTAPGSVSVCSFLFDSREVKGPSLLKIAGERVGPRFLRAVPCLASISEPSRRLGLQHLSPNMNGDLFLPPC